MSAYGYDWHQTLVGRIEAAQRPIRLNEAADLAALFGVTVEALLTGAGPDINTWALERQIEDAQAQIGKAAGELDAARKRRDEAAALLAPLQQEQERAEAALAREQGELASLTHLLKQLQGKDASP